MRKPLQGTRNIIRFNRHFFVGAVIAVALLFILKYYADNALCLLLNILIFIIVVQVAVSLSVSMYVYDFSGFYSLNWLNKFDIKPYQTLININAGFDETSFLLAEKFPNNELSVLNFYNKEKHTEISIRYAQRAFPPFLNTIQTDTSEVPLPDNFADFILLIFAAHEIRNNDERIIFFKELNRILKQNGRIILVEHLRNIPNFLGYNIGFLHFLSLATWRKTFTDAGFQMEETNMPNPFIVQITLK